MQISMKGKYSVRAVLDIAQNSNGAPVTLTAISKREGISLLFLEQLFQQLRKGDIVKSIRGPHGGYVLARDASEITIGEVVRLVEPPLYSSSCFDKTERSEEHTSELQSQSNLVCRLLLEKKKIHSLST